MKYHAKIFIRHKKGILDPQGKTIKDALHSMKYSTVTEVKMGKLLDMKLEAKNMDDAKSKVNDMCRKFIANPNIEQYTFEIEEI